MTITRPCLIDASENGEQLHVWPKAQTCGMSQFDYTTETMPLSISRSGWPGLNQRPAVPNYYCSSLTLCLLAVPMID